MTINRRHLLAAAPLSALGFAGPAAAAPPCGAGLDAAHFGVHAGAADDQSRALQRALDAAGKARVPLMLTAGVYRVGDIKLSPGSALSGVRGATRLVFTHGLALVSVTQADTVTLSGLTLDGGGQALPDNRGLVHCSDARALRILDCEVLGAGGNGIALERCSGQVTQTTISGAADNGLFCNDCQALRIVGNAIAKSGNGGIRVWQSVKRADGSLIADNRVEDTAARAGGSGQNGNAINVFRAGNVIVRGNRIRNAAFSAIRGAAASDIQIIGNQCAALDEVAIYCEFEFEGAAIADNIVDGAGSGISVTNFKEGGRLATVRGNVVRNLRARIPGTAPETQGFGIGVEADTAVSGNVVEGAQTAGITVGWGEYLRNVAVTGNVVRASGIGVAVSVAPGAGTAVISANVFAGTLRGAIVGMEWRKVVTGDLALAGAERYPQLKIAGNQVS